MAFLLAAIVHFSYKDKGANFSLLVQVLYFVMQTCIVIKY